MTIEDKIRKTPRIYSVEFWRFIFTVIVTLYHLEILYQIKLMPSGTTAVEFFFVLAGFTIAMSAAGRIERGGARELGSKEAGALAWDYLKKKLLAIYPVLAVTLVLAIVVFPLLAPAVPMIPGTGNSSFLARLGTLFSSEWEWLFMVGTPMGFNNTTASAAPIVPLWFLTQLLLVGYLYTFLVNRKYDLMMFAAPLIAVLGFTFFVMNSENILDFYVKMGMFNAGTVRAITNMAMGISIYRIYEYLKGRDWSIIGKIAFQLLELFAIYRYVSLTLRADVSIDNFRRIPYVLIIILLSFANITFFSKLTNRKFMEKLGKLSLTMYLIHFPVATAYWTVLFRLRRDNMAWSLPGILQKSGGMTPWQLPIPLSIGDLLMYIPIVIIISLLINLLVSSLRKLLRRKKPL